MYNYTIGKKQVYIQYGIGVVVVVVVVVNVVDVVVVVVVVVLVALMTDCQVHFQQDACLRLFMQHSFITFIERGKTG